MIDILLSTYNGATHIREQIYSIIANKGVDFRLIIRDDGSSDDTVSIVNEFQEKYNGKIIFIIDNKGNLGPTKSFEELVKHSDAEYFMFSDQDDYWCDYKIHDSLNKIMEIETLHPNTPSVVFTDLYIADTNLNIINDSFVRKNKLDTNVCKDIHKCLALSIAPGCTMIMNKKVKDYILPFPKAVTHDLWVMVNCVKYGFVEYLDKPTIKYRQHGNNQIGADVSGLRYMMSKIINIKKTLSKIFCLLKYIPFKINYFKYLYWKVYYCLKRV